MRISCDKDMTPENLLKSVTERSIQYLAGLQKGNVFPSTEAIDALAKLDKPLPDGPSDIETVIGLLDTIGSPATVLTAGGRAGADTRR